MDLFSSLYPGLVIFYSLVSFTKPYNTLFFIIFYQLFQLSIVAVLIYLNQSVIKETEALAEII